MSEPRWETGFRAATGNGATFHFEKKTENTRMKPWDWCTLRCFCCPLLFIGGGLFYLREGIRQVGMLAFPFAAARGRKKHAERVSYVAFYI